MELFNFEEQDLLEMSLETFISKFDNPGSVVLLEGKRLVLENDKEKLVKLGRALTEMTKHITFRSGNAEGADEYFSAGVASVDNKRLEVIVPYSGHRKNQNVAYTTHALDKINLVNDTDIIYFSKNNKKTNKLIDQFVGGEKNRLTIKASYIIRDTVKVLGTENIPSATFGIFYDDINNPNKGGTGHTIDVCKKNNVPLINQLTWFKWLNEVLK